MKLVSTKNIEKNRYELMIEVDAKEFAPAVDQAFRRNVGKINVPGFRKGKAPKSIVYKMYGEGMFFEEAVNGLYPKAYDEAVKEAGIEPVAMPKIEITKVDAEGFSFTAEVVSRPEVTVSGYKGIKAEKTVKTVGAEEIDEEIARLRQRGARLVEVTGRAAEDGDTAVIDFEGFLDGTAFPGGKGERHNLKLGSGQFIPGFEGQIVGHNPGDSFEVSVTFPEEYHEDLKGKDAVFKVTLHELKCEELPELDDEFAKDVSEFDTLEALREDISAKLQKRYDEESEIALENTIIDAVTENMTVDVPPEMIDVKIDDMIHDFQHRLRAQGLSVDKYIEYMGQTPEAFRDTFKESAEKQIKIRLALEEIAKAEGFVGTEEDIEAEYQKVAARVGRSIDEVKQAIPQEDIREDCAVQKAIAFVKDNAKITETAATADTAEKKPAKKAAPKAEKAEKTEKAEKKPAAKKAAPKKAADGE